LNRGQMTLYDSIDLPGDGFYKFKVRARSTTHGPTGGALRINDELAGEVEIPGRAPEIREIVAFLPKGSHQMAWNINLPPQAQRKPGGKGKTERKKYTELPKNANDIVSEESAKNAPKIPRTNQENSALKKLMDSWDRTQIGVQRPFEWLRLHGKNGNPSELQRFHGYVTERSKPLAKIEREIAVQIGIEPGDLRRKINDANRATEADRARLLNLADFQIIREAKPGQFAVDWIEIVGPLAVGDEKLAVQSAKLFANPQGQKRARPRSEDSREPAPQDDPIMMKQGWIRELSLLIRRAFRRPVEDADLKKFRSIYDASKSAGHSHAEAARQTVVAVLVSPHFLYRIEQGDGEEFELNDWQLASRLSYFLWQTMPDERLFDLAEEGKLRVNLGVEVDRMLRHHRAEIFFESFGGQWLGYSGLGRTIQPDTKKFPEFTPQLAVAMKRETNWLFESVFRENRPVTDLLTARETLVNLTLARHYGIESVKTPGFQIVRHESPERGGILGMGSVLTATSTPVRTSPVIRGVWVMERLLGEDPGEPLADAGELPGNAGEARGKTLREELEIHRDRAECASCHDKIDPLGFGLEQFDAIGRFRTREGRKPIDASGELPDGTKFRGAAELREYLVENRRDEFHRVVTERLLSYALGRELRTADEAAIREILNKGQATNFRAADLVKAVVESYPFTHQAAEHSEF
ncbi:MAG: DUF1592 domain-containing protein, partial [Verrucomicrobiales bacterium]|nr:DUF1592 domain-containing protein [Verrucomicrobiales bacterium]